MVALAPDYYHCFLGNGLDAVLIGPTGSMVADRVGVDRCYWYKSDRYYPEEKLVQVAGRYPSDQPLAHAEGSGWYEIAPLGRTWYEVQQDSTPLPLQGSEQRFVPREGTLYSKVDYGFVRGKVVTFLHAKRSLLVEHYTFDRPIDFRAWLAPGVWVEEGWDTWPFHSVSLHTELPEATYDLGETQGVMGLRLQPEPQSAGAAQNSRWLQVHSRVIVKYSAILDNRQGATDLAPLHAALAQGYQALRREHLAAWEDYFSASTIHIPDEQFQSFYEASMYHFKAMQNPVSGGLPVNNLRRTWSSHIFWDSYYLQRALLEANHRREALEGCRFFQRTLDHARRHAREEFGCGGLKWDWEITHDGRKAYGTLLHQKYQVHNNASYANQIWQYYRFTRDRNMLGDFYPILKGVARFFLECIVVETERGIEVRDSVGVHESPHMVKNEGVNLAGTIAILQRVAAAARALQHPSPFTRRCTAAAAGLQKTLGRLYNGRYFTAAEENDWLNMSSLAPIYPLQVVDFTDYRARSTALAFLEKHGDGMVGHGGNQAGFPWAAGVLATILARQGDGDRAWRVVDSTRPAICTYGGMAEVVENGQWNMQYFGTAQGAVCSALHNLLLQPSGTTLRLFPALPTEWQEAAFEGLLGTGVDVSATYDSASNRVDCQLHNLTRTPLARHVQIADRAVLVKLQPEETQEFSWRV